MYHPEAAWPFFEAHWDGNELAALATIEVLLRTVLVALLVGLLPSVTATLLLDLIVVLLLSTTVVLLVALLDFEELVVFLVLCCFAVEVVFLTVEEALAVDLAIDLGVVFLSVVLLVEKVWRPLGEDTFAVGGQLYVVSTTMTVIYFTDAARATWL